MTLSEDPVVLERPSCPLCRGEGYLLTGALVAMCQECATREWEEFSQGLEDFPPCWGYASCAEECMGLCPWGEECREAAKE